MPREGDLPLDLGADRLRHLAALHPGPRREVPLVGHEHEPLAGVGGIRGDGGVLRRSALPPRRGRGARRRTPRCACRAWTTESTSGPCSVAPLPADAGRVHEAEAAAPASSRRASTESRVVPAISETMDRSAPRSAFTSDDFPTLGRPTTASAISGGSRASSGAPAVSSAAAGIRDADRGRARRRRRCRAPPRRREPRGTRAPTPRAPPFRFPCGRSCSRRRRSRDAGLAAPLRPPAGRPAATPAEAVHDEEDADPPRRIASSALRAHGRRDLRPCPEGSYPPVSKDGTRGRPAASTRSSSDVAGHARKVVHERPPPLHEPVEEGRLADVGAARDHDAEGSPGHRRPQVLRTPPSSRSEKRGCVKGCTSGKRLKIQPAKISLPLSRHRMRAAGFSGSTP